jgi:hypothetical protein
LENLKDDAKVVAKMSEAAVLVYRKSAVVASSISPPKVQLEGSEKKFTRR